MVTISAKVGYNDHKWQGSSFAYIGVYLFIQRSLKIKKKNNFLLKHKNKNGLSVEIT